MGELDGTGASIAGAPRVRALWRMAAAADPADATAEHLLGRWCFSLADLGWASRKIATAVFGAPPTASYDDALAHFMSAEKIDPGFWKKNLVMIATCLVKLGRAKEAKGWLLKALDIEQKTTEDHEAHQDAEKLLRRL